METRASQPEILLKMYVEMDTFLFESSCFYLFLTQGLRFFSFLSAGVGMNRSRCGWNKKEVQGPRATRSSQVRHTDASETLQSGPGQLQDLSQKSVRVAGILPTR